MTDYRDQFEQQLVGASRRLSGTPACRRPRRRAVLLVTAGVLGGGTALAATTPWSPRLGDPHSPQNAPAVSTTPPPGSQRAALSVLRRPAVAADHDADVEAALAFLGPGTPGVRTAYIRNLGPLPAGGHVTLVPVEQWRRGDGRVVRDAACLVATDPAGGAGKDCFSTSSVEAGRAINSLGLSTYGLVPDGVTRIEGDGDLVATVHDNFFAFGTVAVGGTDPIPTRYRSLVGTDDTGRVRVRFPS